jgi:hypothetical protein
MRLLFPGNLFVVVFWSGERLDVSMLRETNKKGKCVMSNRYTTQVRVREERRLVLTKE